MRYAARHIFQPSEATRKVVSRHFDADDIIRLILCADTRSAEFVNADNLGALQGNTQYQTLCNVYDFIKGNVRYQADPLAREWVRSPGYLMQSGAGDCKSLSLAIGALCRAFGIPFKYRFIRQSSKANWHHVYVVAMPTDGSCRRPVILDAVHRAFDSEPAYVRRLDKMPRQANTGIGSLSSESGAVLLVLIGLWFLFSTPTRKKRKTA